MTRLKDSNRPASANGRERPAPNPPKQRQIAAQPAQTSSILSSHAVNVGGRTTPMYVNLVREQVAEKPKLTVMAYFLIDVSGSMAGGKIKKTLEYVFKMIDDVLEKDDRVTVILFNDKTDQICNNTLVKNLDRERISAAALAANGGTALYDAVLKASASINSTKDSAAALGLTVDSTGKAFDRQQNLVLWHLVVFTDGEDVSSTAKFDDMISGLAHPGVANFYGTFLTVGVDKEARNNLNMAFKPIRHCKLLWEDNSSSEDIAKAFGKASKHLREIQIKYKEQLLISMTSNKQPELLNVLRGAFNELSIGGPAVRLAVQDKPEPAGRSRSRGRSAASRSNSVERRR